MMKRHGFARAAAVLLCLLPAPAFAADAPTATEQPRIEQAIREYTDKLRAEQEKARDQVVANRMESLLNDPGTMVFGNPNGDVTIIEFFDYTCPFCKAAEPRLRQLLQDDPKVKLVVKEFPILRPVSLLAAKAALAAIGQGKYAPYHQKMMDFRGQLTDELVFDMAKEAGLDVARLKSDMAAPGIADIIVGNFNLARALRIFDTPTFIIGSHLVTEPSSALDFAKAVAAARAK